MSSLQSRQNWANYFDLSPDSTGQNTLPQTLAHGVHAVVLAHPSPASANIITTILDYILSHIRSNPLTLIRDIDLSAKAATGQLEKDLLLGIGNSLVQPVYCKFTKEASWENAVKCKGLFEVLGRRVREGMVDGREGNEGFVERVEDMEVPEVTEEDLGVPKPDMGRGEQRQG